jgi:hypothetical protein
MASSALSEHDVEKHADRELPTSIGSETTAGTQAADAFVNLRIFQELVGIRSSKQLVSKGSPFTSDDKDDGFVVRPRPPHRKSLNALFFKPSAVNDGYYTCAIQEEYKAFVGYQLSNFVINSVFIAQIFIAATITALSAYPDHRVALTGLGAVNTVLAGLTAYTKGMGLPNRLRKSRDQYQHIKEFIDYKERQFRWSAKLAATNNPDRDPSLANLDPWVAAEQVRRLYEAAQKDEQANYPDMYVNDNQRQELEKIRKSKVDD